VLLIVALLVGYYINLSIYTGETARLNSNSSTKYSLYFCFGETTSDACYGTVQKINNQLLSSAQSANATSVQQFIPVYYWGELRKSMFLGFILGAIAAWLPLFVRQLYIKYKESEEKA